ncbi:MAG: hypothetical protein CL678_03030 [Bdellovibrionaceae bacterium]|nr:hypothetical protein [Pseudobdellovibrionaceae bacterium]|tara:strand:+ start:200 stop:346 length:147 start_codon:yes stop_codon:yes gene_type:complete
MKTVIIGAGVAGSVIADHLTNEGHSVTVLEKDKHPDNFPESRGVSSRT